MHANQALYSVRTTEAYTGMRELKQGTLNAATEDLPPQLGPPTRRIQSSGEKVYRVVREDGRKHIQSSTEGGR